MLPTRPATAALRLSPAASLTADPADSRRWQVFPPADTSAWDVINHVKVNAYLDQHVIPHCGLLLPLLPAGLRARRPIAAGAADAASTDLGAAYTSGRGQRRDRLEGAVLGALIGDALALGAHYEYAAPKIWRAYGGRAISTLDPPGAKSKYTSHLLLLLVWVYV